MNLITKYLTNNDCYKAGKKIKPKGIMLHSTATPGVKAKAWFKLWNKSFKDKEINRQVCVHAFVDDEEVYKYLPWNHRGWHAGGQANNTHIGIELCEPAGFHYSANKMVGYNAYNQEIYFRKVWRNTVELCVMLCEKFKLDDQDIICHAEGYKLGVASNHADVLHWFPKHFKTMDDFRDEVKEKINITVGDVKAESEVYESLNITVGDVVEINDTANTYYPGGVVIPKWVKRDFYHKVIQVESRGKPVIKGGKECVLLGRKVEKVSGLESAGIMTWVDRDLIIRK